MDLLAVTSFAPVLLFSASFDDMVEKRIDKWALLEGWNSFWTFTSLFWTNYLSLIDYTPLSPAFLSNLFYHFKLILTSKPQDLIIKLPCRAKCLSNLLLHSPRRTLRLTSFPKREEIQEENALMILFQNMATCRVSLSTKYSIILTYSKEGVVLNSNWKQTLK